MIPAPTPMPAFAPVLRPPPLLPIPPALGVGVGVGLSLLGIAADVVVPVDVASSDPDPLVDTPAEVVEGENGNEGPGRVSVVVMVGSMPSLKFMVPPRVMGSFPSSLNLVPSL